VDRVGAAVRAAVPIATYVEDAYVRTAMATAVATAMHVRSERSFPRRTALGRPDGGQLRPRCGPASSGLRTPDVRASDPVRPSHGPTVRSADRIRSLCACATVWKPTFPDASRCGIACQQLLSEAGLSTCRSSPKMRISKAGRVGRRGV
jgi:hypothetical protein